MNEDGGQLKGTTTIGPNVMQDVVYECCWDNCDWQFEDMTDCIDHCIAEQNGHVQSSFVNAPSGESRGIAIVATIVNRKSKLLTEYCRRGVSMPMARLWPNKEIRSAVPKCTETRETRQGSAYPQIARPYNTTF